MGSFIFNVVPIVVFWEKSVDSFIFNVFFFPCNLFMLSLGRRVWRVV